MSNYEVRVADVCAYDTNLRLRDMYRGQIIRLATGKVAYETKCYAEKRTARLQAARYVKNFEHHLTKHGIGFEEQQEQKKAAERAEREAKRAAERRLRDAAPDMLAALEYLVSLGGGDALDVARAAIAKAKGE